MAEMITRPPPLPGPEPGFALGFTRVSPELRRLLPEWAAEAVDNIIRQIQVTVFEPLLMAPSDQEIRRIFHAVFGSYTHLHLAMTQLVVGALGRTPGETAAAISQQLDEEWRPPPNTVTFLGTDGAMALTVALDVAHRGLSRAFQTLAVHPERFSNPPTAAWERNFCGMFMASSTVLYGLGASPDRWRQYNLIVLSVWARAFALDFYTESRRLGWLPAPVRVDGVTAIAAAPDDEERFLAESGLAEWATDLRRIERGDTSPR